MTSFTDLGVERALADALTVQGITEPFPIQALVMTDALAGRDVCGKAETGSGKTLAFALPVVQRTKPAAGKGRPRSLVLAPTRELARQILDVTKPLAEAVGLRAAAFYGGTSFDGQVAALRRGVDIAIATPGRFIDLIDRGTVSLADIAIVVLDEADRMADMGFMPQVEWILRKVPTGDHQTLLFSATLDGQVDGLVRHWLHDPVHHEVAPDEESPLDMVHRFLAVHHMDRVAVAAAIAKGVERTIAFVRTKRGADRLVRQLSTHGVRTAAIHGDLRQNARERALRQFTSGKLDVLVATDVAARGIHVDDVDVVVQFDPPEDDKAYVHRAGRTARAGRSGVVATFVLWDQVRDVERLKKRLALPDPIVEVFSNDNRLADLTAF